MEWTQLPPSAEIAAGAHRVTFVKRMLLMLPSKRRGDAAVYHPLRLSVHIPLIQIRIWGRLAPRTFVASSYPMKCSGLE
jgi:hypothetical protein